MNVRVLSVRFVAWCGVLSLVLGSMIVTATVASAATITQSAPLTGSTTVGTSGAFTDQLGVTGSTGTLAFTATGGDVTHLLVSGPGVITTSGALAAGSYVISGTDSDTFERLTRLVRQLAGEGRGDDRK